MIKTIELKSEDVLKFLYLLYQHSLLGIKIRMVHVKEKDSDVFEIVYDDGEDDSGNYLIEYNKKVIKENEVLQNKRKEYLERGEIFKP